MSFDPREALDVAKPFIPSVAGALIGILHNREKPLAENTVAFITGVAVAYFVGGAILVYFDVKHQAVDVAVKFALGLFGKSIVHAIYEQIGPFWQSIRERAVSLLGGPK